MFPLPERPPHRRRNVLRVLQRDTNSIRRLKKKEKKKQWAFQNKAEKLKSLLFQSVILVAVGVHVDRQWDGEVNSASDAPCEFTVKTSPAPQRLIEVWLSQTQYSAGSDYIMLFDGCVQLSVTDAIVCYLKQQPAVRPPRWNHTGRASSFESNTRLKATFAQRQGCKGRTLKKNHTTFCVSLRLRAASVNGCSRKASGRSRTCFFFSFNWNFSNTSRRVIYKNTHNAAHFHVTLTFLGGLAFTVDDGEEVEDLKVLGVDGCWRRKHTHHHHDSTVELLVFGFCFGKTVWLA